MGVYFRRFFTNVSNNDSSRYIRSCESGICIWSADSQCSQLDVILYSGPITRSLNLTEFSENKTRAQNNKSSYLIVWILNLSTINVLETLMTVGKSYQNDWPRIVYHPLIKTLTHREILYYLDKYVTGFWHFASIIWLYKMSFLNKALTFRIKLQFCSIGITNP